MTGQVKEEILARWIELGVRVDAGCLVFEPARVHPREFLRESRAFHYLDPGGEDVTLSLEPGQLGFTFCQVPVVYVPAEQTTITVTYTSGRTETLAGGMLPGAASARIFDRDAAIRRITVQFRSP
jgi:hypothetical protein